MAHPSTRTQQLTAAIPADDIALYTLPQGRERARVSGGAMAAAAPALPADSLVAVMAWAEPVNGLADLARRLGCAASAIAWLPGLTSDSQLSLRARFMRLRRRLQAGESDLLHNSHYTEELQAGHSLLVLRGVDRHSARCLRSHLAQAGALELHHHGRFTVEHLSLAQ